MALFQDTGLAFHLVTIPRVDDTEASVFHHAKQLFHSD